jgi:non-ribosomal peptide synthetase component E (peptide arylation enzyme)
VLRKCLDARHSSARHGYACPHRRAGSLPALPLTAVGKIDKKVIVRQLGRTG